MPEPIGSAAEPQTDDRRTSRMGLLAYPRVIGALDVSAAVKTLAASLSRTRARRLVMPNRRQWLSRRLGSDFRENAFQRLNTWRKRIRVSVDCVRDKSSESSGFFIGQVKNSHDP
jgi:hypothetical protein